MKDENVSFSNFGKPFQERLAQLILDDAPFANQVGEVLNYNYFELRYLQTFTKLVYDYKKSTASIQADRHLRPSFEMIFQERTKLLKRSSVNSMPKSWQGMSKM